MRLMSREASQPPAPAILGSTPTRYLEAPGRVARLIERRERLCGCSVPDPPLPLQLLDLLDDLLAPSVDARLPVIGVARRLRELSAVEF